MRDFYKLTMWQRSHKLTLDIYTATNSFPKEEMFGLKSQIRRACSSIPTNIVEGCGRNSNQDFARFLYIAVGSAAETEYELLLAKDLNYISTEQYNILVEETVAIRKMILTFINTLK